ncbi:uncharacterized protein LY89DRAFT_198893 [Mollisia scopiformis]|uniref:2EXR domain-containing protein n=1 Tax=Mollisia scopiformis TaxID=149040 RepID=A0A194WYJ2_MOLSC|nr:uncharacterized protein LY89DRAFT_198893 [Mollisia scopiformis]KUJ13028.1 hypothetical protein LY89DRAFT_198893 [Mollisia scopiformis]
MSQYPSLQDSHADRLGSSYPGSLSSSFHSRMKFALLPAELRLKIYTLSLPGPRLIPIHYLSANTTPPPSPSPYSYSTSYPPQKRICRRRPTITTSPQNPSHTGCTSPAAIPALLHVNREARLLASSHYTLSFSLAGPFFEPKIWFRQGQDVLYFPAVPGFLATVKHWTSICCLIKGGELGMVRRLAVHEDLFLEERKRMRWMLYLGKRESFVEKVRRIECEVEEEAGGNWRVPRWRVLKGGVEFRSPY